MTLAGVHGGNMPLPCALFFGPMMRRGEARSLSGMAFHNATTSIRGEGKLEFALDDDSMAEISKPGPEEADGRPPRIVPPLLPLPEACGGAMLRAPSPSLTFELRHAPLSLLTSPFTVRGSNATMTGLRCRHP
jgi:hypothetical protein